jgi:ATP-dependent helicase/nuclease subunit A
MANRVFRDLSRWVTLDDEALAKELFSLDQQEPNALKIKEARRLFARAVETPGGLKIQTIHAFCERVLHLFPFEANVPAGFDILDEKTVEAQLLRARESVISSAGRSDPVLRNALAMVIEATGENGFNKVITPLLKERRALRALLQEKSGKSTIENRIKQALGLRHEDTSLSVTHEIFEGRLSDDRLRAMMAVLSRSDAKTDQKTIAVFATTMQLPSSDEWENIYFNVFLTAENTPRAAKGLTTVAIDAIDPSIRTTLLTEQQRLMGLLEKRKATDCAERSCAALRVAGAILAHYEQEKIKAGSLDFAVGAL